MVIARTLLKIKRLKSLVDLELLLFLVLFLDVKLAIKVPAVILIYILRPDFKFGFNLRYSRLPLFYILAPLIAVCDWFISRNFSLNYDLVALTGIGFWLLCLLAMHQVKLSIENHDAETIDRTVTAFFILNAIVSFINIAVIIYKTGHINPYTYQAEYQKYFIGTGDYIKGLTFDTSTTNAVLSAYGLMYFLNKKNAVMLLVCMAVMLMACSNFVNIIVLFVLLVIFIFKSSRDQKSLIVVCGMFLVIFMTKVSPQNYTYVHETIKNNFFPQPIVEKVPKKPLPYITMRDDSTLTPDERKQKIATAYLDSIYLLTHTQPPVKPHRYIAFTETGRIILPVEDINSKPYQHIDETTAYQRQLIGFINGHKQELPISGPGNDQIKLPGKALSSIQTINFLRNHPVKLLIGDGIGNFSSKLAFRASGLGFAGGYPKKISYLSPEFLSNHLDVYLNFFSKKKDYHSLTNSPDSVYDQLLAEYGLIGVFGFVIWYVGYFLRDFRKLTYGLPILAILLAILAIGYWFEQLSILLLFELLLLLDIKENSTKTIATNAN